jgi:hypothetical protein
LKPITPESLPSSPSLQKGQTWEMNESTVHIRLVGKRLVHYKQFKGSFKRVNTSLTSISVLQKYLEENDAILTPEVKS